MKNLEALQYFTPTGTSEGERHILDQIFVEQDDFDRMVIPKPMSPIVLVGKKGSGKSVLLDAVARASLEVDVPVARISPRDMRLVDISADGSVAAHTKVAYDALISSIVERMAADVKGLVTGGDKVLLEEGLRTGVLQRDLIARLAILLPRLARPVIHIPIEEVKILDGNKASSINRIKKVISDKLSSSARNFYVLIDDTDQVADPTNPSHLNRIWGLLLASRDLARLSERIRVIVTIREEVWRRLNRTGAGQRDQADHFDRIVIRLTPSEKLMKAIVEQRLVAALGRVDHHDNGSPWPLFFNGSKARIPTSNEFSSWSDLIVSRSRSRPRDAIQLLNSLAEAALKRGATHIDQDDLDREVPNFSKKRVEFLRNEAEDECPDVQKVVESLARINFDQGSFKASFEILRAAMHKIPSNGVALLKRKLSPNNDEDFLRLLEFLFDYDVLNARMSDVREKDGYRFIRPDEDSTLITSGRWSDLQRIVWEVNPAFRDHLISVQRTSVAGAGLASKPKGKGR